MSAALYVVATPIGNLNDITLRAIATLRAVDLVAAEDTRRSKQLLNHLQIHKPMLSVHEHNEQERIAMILKHLQSGASIALVSDAGTPLISDPGYALTRGVIEAGFEVIPIPGASSVLTALSAAGLPTDHFTFHGFLSSKNRERQRQLKSAMEQVGTHIIFESTHRIQRLLEDINQLFPQQSIVLAKELTKRHERFIRGKASDCIALFEQDPGLLKGEFVVLWHSERAEQKTVFSTSIEQLMRRLQQEMSLKQAVKVAADLTGQKKNELYQLALELADDDHKPSE